MTSVNPSFLLRCAKLSYVSYNDEIKKCVDSLEPILLLDHKCWIFYDKLHNMLFVAFRGSDSCFDLINNLNIIPRKYKEYGKVHAGYYHYYSSIKNDIIDFIECSSKDIRRIVTTGHSCGGTNAVLASLDIKEHFNVGVSCVTFGAPPLSDETFSENHNKLVPDTYRVVNVEDFAPKLPIPGLCHVGKPVLLCNSKKDCKVRIPLMPSKIVHSHSMSRYVADLYQIKKINASKNIIF